MGQQYYGYPLRTRSSRRLVGTLSPSSSSPQSFYDSPSALRGIISQQYSRALHLPFPGEDSPRTRVPFPHFIPVISARQHGVTALVTLFLQLSFCPPSTVLELWRRSVLSLQCTAELGVLAPFSGRSMATEPGFEELQQWIFDTLAQYVPSSAAPDLFLGLQSLIDAPSSGRSPFLGVLTVPTSGRPRSLDGELHATLLRIAPWLTHTNGRVPLDITTALTLMADPQSRPCVQIRELEWGLQILRRRIHLRISACHLSRQEFRTQRALTLMMGRHHRLGRDPQFKDLDEDTLKHLTEAAMVLDPEARRNHVPHCVQFTLSLPLILVHTHCCRYWS